MKNIVLFNDFDLMSVLEGQQSKISETISAVSPQVILEKNTAELISNLVTELKVQPIELLEDDINVEQSEAKVDVSGDVMRFIDNRSEPCG